MSRSGPRVVAAVLLCAASWAAGCAERAEPGAGARLETLDARFEPLRAAFDADAAHVRLLAILSPT